VGSFSWACSAPPSPIYGVDPMPRSNGPRRLWVAVSFVNFVGPIAYFAFGRRR
jgi:hypothetical protein